MLNIFADALLLAVRQSPLPRRPQHEYPTPTAEAQSRRKWFSLTGILM
ncbi:MAG: hypothetical protein ACRC14_17860 [Paracoccaceae bacterium]